MSEQRTCRNCRQPPPEYRSRLRKGLCHDCYYGRRPVVAAATGLMTEEQAEERRARIVAELLRQGATEAAIKERFAQHEPNLTRIRRRFGIEPFTASDLPLGMPV